MKHSCANMVGLNQNANGCCCWDDDDHHDGFQVYAQWGETFRISGMDDLGSEKSTCSSIGGGGGRSDLVSSSMSEANGASTHEGHQQRTSRAGRVRTVLTEKQLGTLKSCYSVNPRPDGLMKEQLVEMTGLSPRVVRVWFQNKRCKDKKKMSIQKSKVINNLKQVYLLLRGIRSGIIAFDPQMRILKMAGTCSLYRWWWCTLVVYTIDR